MDNLSSNSTIDELSSTTYINIGLSRTIWLIILSTLLVPSVLLALYVFYSIFRMLEIQNRLINHTIICIFIVSFIQATCEMPFLLAYLSHGHVPFDSYGFCKFWIAFNFTLNTTILFLNSHLSIERYFLVFHHNFVNRHKVLVHYIPMVIAVVAAVGYSCSTVLFYPCSETFDYSAQLCGGPCYQLQPSIGTFDLVFTIFMPLACIIFFNCLLSLRVIQQKRRMLQKNVWKKNLGMLVQLITVSMLHTIVWMPVTIVVIITLAYSPPSDIISQLLSSWTLINIVYLAVLGNPLVCLFVIPELREKVINFKNRIRGQQPQQLRGTAINQIHPSTVQTRPTD